MFLFASKNQGRTTCFKTFDAQNLLLLIWMKICLQVFVHSFQSQNPAKVQTHRKLMDKELRSLPRTEQLIVHF